MAIIKRNWRSLVSAMLSAMLGSLLTIVSWAWLGGKAAGAIETRVANTEARVMQIEAREDRLEQLIYSRLGSIEEKVTRIDAEQCVYHRGSGCQGRR